MIKKSFLWLILAALAAWAAVFSLPDDRLHLIFCDVGQGDAILISQKETQILIDGGPNEKVLQCLSRHLPFWDRQIEMVILTHPEADHLTGLVSVIERYDVEQIISNSLVAESAVFSKFRNTVIGRQIPVFSPKYGDKIKMASLELKILYPKEKLGNELVWQKADATQVLGLTSYTGKFNETAIVGLLSFGNFDALLTGDIGFDTEEKLDLAPVEVLKVAHHGSKYSTSEEFLEAIRPALAVISVGKNSYGHPTQEVIDRISNLGIKLLRTDEAGDVEVVSDDRGWWLKK